MELITNLFDMDFAALVPEMSVFLRSTKTILILAMLAGPIALTVLGYLYLYKPTPEANYNFGYRTYYGMGSVEAWRFSQRIAGLIFGILGVALTVIMLIVFLFLINKNLLQTAKTAAICLFIQVALVLTARTAIALMAKKYFDKDGNRRQKY